MVPMKVDEVVDYATNERWAIRILSLQPTVTKAKVLGMLKVGNHPVFELQTDIPYSEAADTIARLPENPRTVFVIVGLDEARSGSQRVVLDLLTHQRPIIAVDHPVQKAMELSISLRTRFVQTEVEE